MYADEFSIYAGNANRPLAEQICRYLRTELGKAEVFKFANDNIFVRVMENVREQDVFLVQPTSRPVNDSVMELLIMIDAFKRASAGRITAVMPYYAYGRSDKKDQPRVPITARLVADMLTVAGADRVLTMDLHQGQIQGFFSIPVDELTAVNILSRYIREKNLDDIVVVSELGFAKKARNFAEILEAPAGDRREATGRQRGQDRADEHHRRGRRQDGGDHRRRDRYRGLAARGGRRAGGGGRRRRSTRAPRTASSRTSRWSTSRPARSPR